MRVITQKDLHGTSNIVPFNLLQKCPKLSFGSKAIQYSPRIKFINNIYFYFFHLHLFQKHLVTFLIGNLLKKCPQMFIGPVRPVEIFFYWHEAVLGKFYWPWASSLQLASSPVNKTVHEMVIRIAWAPDRFH